MNTLCPRDRVNEYCKKLTVLQDISNNAELVKVTTPTLSSEGLLKRDLDIVDVVLIPSGTHRDVGETQDEHVLHHFFSEIVVNPERFVLCPVLLDGPNELSARLGVFTERLFDDDPVDTTPEDVTVPLEVLGDRDEDRRREGEIEDTVPLLGLILGFDLVKVFVKPLERLVRIICAGDVGRDGLELLDLLLHLFLVTGVFDVSRYPLVVLLRVHLRPSIADDFDVPREKALSVESEKSRVRLTS